MDDIFTRRDIKGGNEGSKRVTTRRKGEKKDIHDEAPEGGHTSPSPTSPTVDNASHEGFDGETDRKERSDKRGSKGNDVADGDRKPKGRSVSDSIAIPAKNGKVSVIMRPLATRYPARGKKRSAGLRSRCMMTKTANDDAVAPTSIFEPDKEASGDGKKCNLTPNTNLKVLRRTREQLGTTTIYHRELSSASRQHRKPPPKHNILRNNRPCLHPKMEQITVTMATRRRQPRRRCLSYQFSLYRAPIERKGLRITPNVNVYT